jgi:hypothetical protein
MDRMLQGLFGGSMPQYDGEMPIPDISNFAKMLGSMGLNEETADNAEIDENKIAEAQKMFEDCMNQIQKDTEEARKLDSK